MPELPEPTPAELDAARAATVARGRALQRRRRASVLGGGAVGVVVVALLVAGLGGDGGDEEVRTADAPTPTTHGTTTTSLPSTTTSTATTAPPIETTTTEPPPPATTTTEPPPTTTPPPPERVCVSATGDGAPPDPAWATTWQTEPAYNDPATITFCVDDVTPAVGQVVTAAIRTDDPDAPYLAECEAMVVQQGELSLCRDVAYQQPSEPMPTPAERPGTWEETFQFSFDRSGSTTVQAIGWSGEIVLPPPCSGVCTFAGAYSPYTSRVTVDLQLVVG